MLQNGLREKLGDTICGMPMDEVIDGTWADIADAHSVYGSVTSGGFMENNMETAMQILGTVIKRKDMQHFTTE